MQVAAGQDEAAASHYRSLAAEHPGDWEILLSYLDIKVPLSSPARSPLQVLQGLEKLSMTEVSDEQVRHFNPVEASHRLDAFQWSLIPTFHGWSDRNACDIPSTTCRI